TLASQAAIKAKARKAARQASRDAGNVNLSSGFDPDIIYDAIDDAIIWIAERAYPIEVAVREAIKAHKLPEDAASQIRKGIDDEFANLKAPVPRTLDDAPATKTASETVSPGADATGLANRVQEEEALGGIIKQVAPAKGEGAKHWQEAGKAAVEDGADYELLAQKIARGEAELTGENVGILLEGKRQLLAKVNRLREGLKANPGLRAQYEEAQEQLQDYLEAVQAGKGRWSDVGRALQGGTQLDTGDYAAVIAEAEASGKKVSPAL